MAYDARACYNCNLDLVTAEMEEAKTPRAFTFGSFVVFCVVAFIGIFGIIEGVRYSKWSAYHEQLTKLDNYSGTLVAPQLPVPPNDPVQGSLKSWPHNTDPYNKSDLGPTNVVASNR